MKKITLALMAVMLVLGMTQCKKEQPTPTPYPTPDGEVVYISMKVDDGGKHIVYPGTGAYVFEDGDVIYVGNNGHYVGTLTYNKGTFSGSITNPSTSDYLHFYFTGGKAPTDAPTAGSTTSFTVNISDQTSKLPILSYGRSHIKYVNGTTAYNCMLENKCGLVKFVPTIATSEVIRVGGMKTTATINFATPGITPTNATGNVKLYAASNSEKWAILLPQNEVASPQVTINHFINTAIENVPSVTANLYSTAGVSIAMTAVPTGAIAGKFTINENNDQVYFSQGNLQYMGSAASPYWKFADNQFDYFGTTGNKSTSTNVNRDLFGWGTSGWNNGNIYFQPYNYQNGNSYYNAAYGYGPTNGTNYTYDLTSTYANADWGVYNAISNGGNTSGSWRTLTNAEWDYIINSRETTSGIRFAKGKVNNNNGLILLPDDWSPSIYSLAKTNNKEADWSSNSINSEDWAIMEATGAVFLPCAGYRYQSSTDNSIQYSITSGHYWGSTVYNGNFRYACCMQFNSSGLYTTTAAQRSYGSSVRLVRNVE